MSAGTGWGITEQGFVAQQLTDALDDIEQGLIAQFGANINLSPESFFSQISGIVAERLSLVWQAMQDVYNSQNPDTAFGASLDNIGALRGIPRLKASSSSIQNVKLFGTPGTPIPSTLQASVNGSPLSVFQITGSTTLGSGQNCIQTITFSAAPASGNWSLSLNGSSSVSLPYNATALQVQNAIQALNFASGCTVTQVSSTQYQVTFNGEATGGLMVQPLFGIASNTLEDGGSNPISVIPAITQPGMDQANVTFNATQTGPIVANAGTLTNIVTPISGLDLILNIQDAFLGTNVETDNAYRARMAQELQIAGAGTVPAIRSKLLSVNGVISALVYENITDVADSRGRPPHSFECVVNGGTDSDIANAIWEAKPAGVATFGTSSYVITDSQGQSHTIYFSRPTQVDIYIIANLTVNSNYPSNGDTLVKEALSNYVNGLGQGASVIVIPLLISQLATIPGIDDAELLVGTSPGPTLPNNIPIVPYEQAYCQTDFITVNDTPG